MKLVLTLIPKSNKHPTENENSYTLISLKGMDKLKKNANRIEEDIIHEVSATFTPVGMSCQDYQYCSSWSSQ